jgi:hypothetical protein
MKPMPQKRWTKINKRESELLYEFYDGYDELFDYLRRVKIDSRQVRDHGSHAAFMLNTQCGSIVKRGGKVYLDELSQDNGFESINEFWEHLMNYQPKYRRVMRLKEELGLDNEEEIC